jgi:hypothetical protein
LSLRRVYPLLWTTVLIASALGSYLFLRGALVESMPDPTRDRIQALIDEADQLMRTLDDQRRA